MRCDVHIVEPMLWRLVGKREIRDALQGRLPVVDVDYFNVFARAARILLERMAEEARFLASDDDAPQHLVVVGSGRFARSLIVRATRRAIRLGRELEITMVGPQAEVRRDQLLLSYHPWPTDLEKTMRAVEVETLSQPFADALGYADGREAPTAVCVSLDDEGAGLVTALLMEHLPLAGDAPIYVRMRHESGLAHLLPEGGRVPLRLRPCGMLEATCDELIRTGGMFGDLARRLHGRYSRERERAGETHDTNDLLTPWEQLSDTWRAHKRFRVQRLLLIMAELGFECTSTLALKGEPFRFTPPEAAVLAELAHEDYRARMRELGGAVGRMSPWERRFTQVRQDLPWSHLEPKLRQRDRVRIELLPEVLEEEGITVTRCECDPDTYGQRRTARMIAH